NSRSAPWSTASLHGRLRIFRLLPPLLLFQPVGVDTGERLDQSGLAVVDVAGGTDDHVFHGVRFHPTTGESSTRAPGGQRRSNLSRGRGAGESRCAGGGTQRPRGARAGAGGF